MYNGHNIMNEDCAFAQSVCCIVKNGFGWRGGFACTFKTE